ncbi:GntR family transcriptional regulator [Catenuloplanes atrovinosus]|uniref:GntR family transcriptional regulator n=1 Tax=Catenuloplanes atrovinosus TaxID=137266 RepID=A0AAE4CE56_9ACTN|nr:GntR family transcriptional regulator [Catenuloplanes atrovinosus]MDR7280798.1 GntR family transcriptional regulator [Catenuloplanes atrovinosus]
METRERREPKYLTIAADLAAKIRAGEYAPGAALPPQRELSVAYGVTLATLRAALARLESDGLLSQQAGRGTFVAEPAAAYRLDSLRSLADDLREQGHVVGTDLIGIGPRKAPAWATDALGLPPGDRITRVERVRLIAGRPALHQISWVRSPYGTPLLDVDFARTSLYHALADQGVVVHRAHERLRPDVLRPPIAPLLRQPEGTPVFLSDRVTYGLDGIPVVMDRATILGTTMEIRAERTAAGLSLRWHA